MPPHSVQTNLLHGLKPSVAIILGSVSSPVVIGRNPLDICSVGTVRKKKASWRRMVANIVNISQLGYQCGRCETGTDRHGWGCWTEAEETGASGNADEGSDVGRED